jgi:phenylacetate-CoA ligase
MPDAMLHPEFEGLAPQDVRRIQERLWSDQWDHVRSTSAFYRARFDRHLPAELDLDALQQLAFTDKEELRCSQERSYPFGDYIACREDQVVRLHRTSGTTGRPLQLANSRRDVEVTARIGGRAMFAAGLRPGDRVVHCLNYCMWTGGVTDHLTLEAAGACVVPFGVGHTERLLETIEDLRVTAISCTPSYPSLLDKVLRTANRQPRELGLSLGLFGGEAGLDIPEFRQGLEATWGFRARNANYGMSEILSNFASQCERTNDFHFHGAEAIFAEIVDPAGNRLPLRDGSTGELVCTHLIKECQPLIRYRTRDLIAVTGTGPCDCGRSSWRFRVTGRTDDMFNVRGINVFPSAVQKGVLSRPDICSGQFRIVLEGAGPYDRIEVEAEAAHGLAPKDWQSAARALEAAIREHAGASTAVVLLAPDSLPRTEGKTTWLVRR